MRAIPLLLVLLVGCTTYPDDCDRRAMGQLRTVERLISETRANLARGYTYEYRESDWGGSLVLCSGSGRGRYYGGGAAFCTGTGTRTMRYPVAIDPDAEQRKLRSLEERRRALIPATASCRPA